MNNSIKSNRGNDKNIYRSEIDGLRALSVLVVFFYHLDFSFFKGGYLGVDIFFVISGYLITQIITIEFTQNQFTFFSFYERRIRRILPILYLVVVVSFFASYVILFPRDFREFGQSLASIPFFSSNIFFWLKSGYFETSSELRPLLHTWSLSVEEQFYLIYPLFLIFFLKKKKYLLPTMCFIFFCSLCYSEYQSYNSPSSNFYLIFSRIWQVLAGGLFYYFEKKINIKKDLINELISLIGLILIFGSIFSFNINTPSPSFSTLPLVFGTGLILVTKNITIINSTLSNKYLTYLGKLSYGIYLWHFPIISYSKYTNVLNYSYQKWLIIIFTIILSYLSYILIENPIRKKKILSFKKIIIIFSSLSILFVLVGTKLHYTTIYNISLLQQDKHWLNTFKIHKIKKDSIELVKNLNENTEISAYPPTSQNQKKILIIGDSMAEDAVAALKINKANLFVWKIMYDDLCLNTDIKLKNCIISRKNFDKKYSLIQKADLIYFISGFTYETRIEKISEIFKRDELDKLQIITSAHFTDPIWLMKKIKINNLSIGDEKYLDLLYGRLLHHDTYMAAKRIKKWAINNKVDFTSGYDLQCKKFDESYSCPFIRNEKLMVFDTAHKTKQGLKLYGEQLIDAINKKLEISN